MCRNRCTNTAPINEVNVERHNIPDDGTYTSRDEYEQADLFVGTITNNIEDKPSDLWYANVNV